MKQNNKASKKLIREIEQMLKLLQMLSKSSKKVLIRSIYKYFRKDQLTMEN